MTDFKDLKKKRSCYKGRLTVFGNYLSTVNVSAPSPCQVMELQLRVDKFERLYDEFNEIQLQLECVSDNIDIEIIERDAIESQYYSLLAQAKNIINVFAKSSQDECTSTRLNRQLVKLPTIKLPKFAGLYDNWLEFRDTFSSLIHGNDDIDEINKFHYLRSSLEGTAAVVIQSIEFSAQNYVMAWELLCERFDNKRLLIQNHITSLFNLEPIAKESSILLKRVIDQVNKNIRALGTLGEPVHSWDTLLIYIISHKLDTKTFREWEEHKGRLDKNKSISFNTFIEFLKNYADLIETLETSRHPHSNKEIVIKPNMKPKTMVSISNTDHSITSLKCPHCNGQHNLNSCSKFLALSVTERLSVIPSYRICYNCLRRGHFANRCKKSGCTICTRKHNTLIHNTNLKSPRVDINSSINSTTDMNETHCTTVIDNVPVALSANLSAHTHRGSGSGGVLLSTALVKCKDTNDNEHIVRALLDSGSSSCLMTQRLFNKLKLPCIDTNMYIQGINDSSSHVDKMCRLHIQSLYDNNCTNELLCFVLPTITGNVPARQVQIDIPPNIHLADPYFYSPAPIDLIIGADLFWHLLGSERIILGENKPILCQTKLGWLVSGPINGGYNHCITSETSSISYKVNIHSSTGLDELDDTQNRYAF